MDDLELSRQTADPLDVLGYGRWFALDRDIRVLHQLGVS
jgi:hypothetical protein